MAYSGGRLSCSNAVVGKANRKPEQPADFLKRSQCGICGSGLYLGNLPAGKSEHLGKLLLSHTKALRLGPGRRKAPWHARSARI